MSPRWDRAAAAVAVVLGLLLVVGASSRRPLEGGAAAPALPTWPLLFVVGVGLVLSAALGLSVLGPMMQVRAGRTGRGRMRAGPLTLAASILLPAAIIALYATPGPNGGRIAVGPPPAPPSHNKLAGEPGTRGADHTTGIAAVAAGIAAGVVGLAGVALLRVRRRRREPEAAPRATVAEGARDAAAAAAIPADPRAAVLAAYCTHGGVPRDRRAGPTPQ